MLEGSIPVVSRHSARWEREKEEMLFGIKFRHLITALFRFSCVLNCLCSFSIAFYFECLFKPSPIIIIIIIIIINKIVINMTAFFKP